MSEDGAFEGAGVDPESLDFTAQASTLTVRGQRTLETAVEDNVLTFRGTSDDQAPEGMSLVYGEYETGDYHREFSLSSKIEVQATGA